MFVDIINYIPDTLFFSSMLVGSYVYPNNIPVVLLLLSTVCFLKKPNFMDRWARNAELNRIKEELEDINEYLLYHKNKSDDDEASEDEEDNDYTSEDENITSSDDEAKLLKMVKDQYQKNENLRKLIKQIQESN